MPFRYAYITKYLEKRDFSDLEKVCDDYFFLFRKELRPPDEILARLYDILNTFDPDLDLLVMAGAGVVSGLAFGILMERYHRCNIAIYMDGTYQYWRAVTERNTMRLENWEDMHARARC